MIFCFNCILYDKYNGLLSVSRPAPSVLRKQKCHHPNCMTFP